MRRFLVLLLPAFLVAGEAATVVAEPTGDEVAVLQLANQHRTDRRLGDNLISNLIRLKQVPGRADAWQHHVDKTNAPPLVINPTLTAVARKLLKDGVQAPDKKPYDALPALRAAGYTAGTEAQALFAPDAASLRIAYAMTMMNVVAVKVGNNQSVDLYSGPEGALKSKWREVGIAVGGSAAKPSVVIVLSQGSAKRHLGGVVYSDANHNMVYDVGEGKTGVTVTCGTATVTSGAGGAWWLAQDSDAEGEVAFSVDGLTAKRPLTKGTDNVAVDWRVPSPADLKTADKLITEAEKVAKVDDVDKKRVQLAALLTGTNMLPLDDARQKRVETLVEPIRGSYDSALDKILEAMLEEPADFKKALGDIQKTWKGTMPAWFKEVDAMYRLRQQVGTTLTAKAEQQGKLAEALLKQVVKAKGETVDQRFLRQYETWDEQLTAVLPVEAAPAPAPKKK